MSDAETRKTMKVFDLTFTGFLFMTVVICSGVSVIIPAIPNIMREFGIGAGFVSITFVTLLVGRFLASIFTGILLLRFPPYKLMYASFLLHIVTMVCLTFSQSGISFAILRFFEGVFEGMVSVLLQVLVIGLSKPENRGIKMGYMQSAFGFGFIFGPLLGSFAMQFSGARGVFVLTAGLVFFCILWLTVIYSSMRRHLDIPPRQPISFGFDFVRFMPLYGGPILQRLLVVAFAMILPLYLVDRFAFAPYQVGYFFTMSAIVTTLSMPLTGRLANHRNVHHFVTASMVVMGLSILGMCLAQSRTMFIAMFLLETMGFAVMAPNAMKIFGDLVAEDPRCGEIIGTASSFRELLNILLAIVFIPIYEFNPVVAWLILSFFCIFLSLPYLNGPNLAKSESVRVRHVTPVESTRE